jgi:hypothetical protein
LADAYGRDFGIGWVMHELFGVIWLGVTIGRGNWPSVARPLTVPSARCKIRRVIPMTLEQ